MITCLKAGAAGLLFLLVGCSPSQDSRWGADRNAMTNQSIADVLADKLRATMPDGGTVLVVKHPRTDQGEKEPSEARFQALKTALRDRPFTFRTGGIDIPAFKRTEKDTVFVDLKLDGFWAAAGEWAGREPAPGALVILQSFSPIPTPAELSRLPPLYGVVPGPDPAYAAMVASGEAKLILVQQNDGAAMMEAEKKFDQLTARERIALFYEVLE